MKVFFALVPAFALLASAAPFSGNTNVTSLKGEDASFEYLAGNTTTPGVETLPSCAIPCVQIAVNSASDCELTDVPCLCKNRAKIAKAAKDCLVSTCGAKKTLKKVKPQVQALCKGEDEKEKKRLKEEKEKAKELEKARKKAEKEQKEAEKKQKEEEKKRLKEEKKKQKEKEKEEKKKQKEDEKKKEEEQKAWEELQKRKRRG
ncbi:hypothetical protein TrVFT333_010909 [Trichoderma virens FT-333]|nr:hypothetical protein TrVFT333_010909 [Trichoderma virens FT-333]